MNPIRAIGAVPEQDPEDLDRPGPVVMRTVVGVRLRALRERAGVTAARAALAIRASHSKISRLECGQVGFKPRDISDLLTLYRVPEQIPAMLELARRAARPGWWNDYADVLDKDLETVLGLEFGAALIRNFDAHLVPELLQTPGYARAALEILHPTADEVRIERMRQLLLGRRRILHAARPTILWAILDEACLRRQVGGPQVMADQIRRLIEICELPNVAVQLLPFAAGGHAARSGAVTILRFDQEEVPDAVCLPQLSGTVHSDRQPDIDRSMDLMNELTLLAPPPTATPVLLAQILRETELATESAPPRTASRRPRSPAGIAEVLPGAIPRPR